MYDATLKAIFFGFILFRAFTINAQTPTVCLKPVQVAEATKENWAPGIVRENSANAGGVIYQVSVKIRKKGDVTFQSLIVDDQVLNIEAVKYGERNASGPFLKGDELLLIARSDQSKEAAGADAPLLQKVEEQKAEGAILYTFRSKQYLRPIEAFAVKRDNPLSN